MGGFYSHPFFANLYETFKNFSYYISKVNNLSSGRKEKNAAGQTDLPWRRRCMSCCFKGQQTPNFRNQGNIWCRHTVVFAEQWPRGRRLHYAKLVDAIIICRTTAKEKKPSCSSLWLCPFCKRRLLKYQSRRSFIPQKNDAVTLESTAADRRQPPWRT